MTDTLGVVTTPPVNPSPYKSATTSLMRTTILDGLHDLLLQRTWSTVNMTDVAVSAGISRQTLYKEFGITAAHVVQEAERVRLR